MWVFEPWSSGMMWSRSVTVPLWSWRARAAEGDRMSQTGPWVSLHWAPDPFDVWSLQLTNSWCSSTSSPVPHYTGRPPIFEKMSRQVQVFSRMQPIWASPSPSGPLLNWETLPWLLSEYVFGVWCALSVWSLRIIESLCKLIPKSQYHLKKFTCAELHEVNKCLKD